MPLTWSYVDPTTVYPFYAYGELSEVRVMAKSSKSSKAARDQAADRKAGIKPGSKQDQAIDKRKGVPPKY